MWTLAVVGVGVAAPPDREVRLWDIPGGQGQVERMSFTPSGDVVAGRTATDLEGWLVDIDGWVMKTFGGKNGTATGCEVTGVAGITVTDEDGDEVEEIWMSCRDGSVRGVSWDGVLLTDVVDSTGDPIVFEGVDETLSGIWYDDDPALLYALHVPESAEVARVHVINPFELGFDSDVFGSYPTNLVDDNFVEGAIVDGRLIVAHGGENLSILDLGFNGAAARANAFNGATACADLAPSPFGGIYCVGAPSDVSLGTAAEYRPLANQWYPLLLGELNGPQAVVASLERDEEGALVDGWLGVTGYQVKVWVMDENGAFPTTDPYFAGPEDADNPIQDMVADDGYIYGGGEGPNLHIVTSRPWVYPNGATLDPTFAVSGDTVTLSFVVNQDTDWELYLGGNRFGGGSLVDSGSTLAEATVTTELTVGDAYEEGTNYLYVIATNAEGITGHARLDLTVDNPPDPPKLTNASLAFSDGALVLSFDGIDDADLDRYEVYVSEAAFTAGAWPTGGPPFDGTTNLKTPIKLFSEPGARVTHRIQPLENETTYHVAVRAWDTAGKEGPMSRVIEGTPHETFDAADLAGETGGAPCSTGPAPATLATLGLAGWLLAAHRRTARRRTGKALGGVAAAVALALTSATASAQDDDDRWWKQDQTPARANFELRYGTMQLDDPNIEAVFNDKPHDILMAEIGGQILRYGEIDFGFGFLQDLGVKVTQDLSLESGDRTMLTWWPLYIDATLRAHVLDEQPVVPFVRYGWDYIIYSNKTDNASGGKDTLNGAKFGTHYGLGVNLLLDLLQPKRASFLEARTGINDSWITIEYRVQAVDGRSRPWKGPTADGFDFSGGGLQVGLKLDW